MSATLDVPVSVPDLRLGGVAKALAGFDRGRHLARRHQAEVIGKDVDPDYCWGDFLSCIKMARGRFATYQQRYHGIKRLETVYHSGYLEVPEEKAAMGEGSGIIGGYLVPYAFSSALMVGVAERSIFRRFGSPVVECESGKSNLLPVFDYGNVLNQTLKTGQPPYWGSLWPQIAPSGSFAESEPLFRQIELTPWHIAFNAYESNTMRQDMMAGANTEGMLIQGFAECTAWAEDYLFFEGSGVGQPLGIIHAPGTLLVTRGSSGPLAADTQAMFGDMLPLCAESAIWVAQTSVLARLTAITGWVPNTAGPLFLHGRPVVQSSKPSTVGTTGDLLYFAPSMYAIGVRKNADMLLDFSDQVPTPFLANQSVWRMNHRVDGQPRLATTVTLEDQVTIVAGFVALH